MIRSGHTAQPAPGGRRGFFRLLGTLALLPALLAGGCAKTDDEAGGEEQSQVIIGLTDAQGDFLNYTVVVSSLTLTRADGAVVQTLPLSTEVDFSQYTELTEVLTAASVPIGSYVKGTLTLDYSDAEIWVEDGAGAAVRVTDLRDGAGNPLSGEVAVEVHLQDRDRLVVRRGLPAHMTLDFDLKASNTVSFDDPDNPSVTVEPFLLADVELERPKPQRVRGPLASVDVAGGDYQVIIRPFFHRLSGEDRRFGTLTVATTATTLFDIDNQALQGEAGLAALAAAPALTATVAIGELRGNPRRFEAREVYAGASVPGGDLDVVRGTVLSRTGDTLTVRGATLIRAGGSVAFNDDVSVLLADTTVVRKQFSADPQDIDAVSVGQRVSVFGTLTDTVDLELDAGSGYVRMLLSGLAGTRTDDPAADDAELVLDLQSINGRRVALYDFAGTGDAEDAAADAYQVDTGALDLAAIAAGAPVKVRGFPTPFGSAPADFTAQTVIDLGELRAVLVANWDPANAGGLSPGSDAITLDLAGAGAWHYLLRGGVATDLLPLDPPPRLVPLESGTGAFLVQQAQSVRLHTRFSQLVADLESRLAAGATVESVRASGSWDDGGSALSARGAWIRLR